MLRTIKVDRGHKIVSHGMPYGTVVSAGESDGTHTLVFDDEKGLDSVARELDKDRLAVFNRIVEDVLNGKKWIVEIVSAEHHYERVPDVVDAMVNTVYARSPDRLPLVESVDTLGVFVHACERVSQDELMKQIDDLSNVDLLILNTQEWCTEMVNYRESSIYSRETVMGYRRFMRLLSSRLATEWAERQFIALKFSRWQFPGVRWVKRMRCKISNRIWHADLDFCEGSKETCKES